MSLPKTTATGLLSALVATLVLSAAPTSVLADRVKLSVGEQREAGQELPRNGLTQERVKEHYGEPRRRIAPVGEPPISRWEYEDYIVYFEHDRVLKTVVKYRAEEKSTQSRTNGG